MDSKIKDLTIEEFRLLLSNTLKEVMEDLKEDMLALSSQDYIDSIKESRKDYKEGKFKNLEDILNV
ncbi:MAG: hypothetical protein APG08_01323 [Candidatus Methanofastidiosum methylothiophilum]|uniref:Addiction module component n=1 Tax=Candidatus Methanofastidiosum methylothiophilum TaxID=1705564 RepID=A0A150JC98_9EURY|nr:MAG: hypothetical protein AN188_00817 [Candidatus Methanofastidiosum methylthiophilus]KYC55889.1 MAG: hypothetical protein APG08_01323 [Candidatus Methanofastidiosum methylthiophilus]KYC58595.1 MAG: hypothetical protein APG09_00069 [Candidatus Methanofastidiosum methylthiophilus]OQC50043.1 MAG: hypothetical protein BWX56_01401 [Euryarchaeota archaeon ADurb.Bin023]